VFISSDNLDLERDARGFGPAVTGRDQRLSLLDCRVRNPDDMTELVRRRIVVGVDGSDNSREALRWAVSYAAAGDIVELVHAWSVDVVDRSAVVGAGSSPSDSGTLEAAVTRQLYDIADEVLEDEDRELLELRFTVVRGRAAETLAERSQGADLLVVGRRGLGGFPALLIGSVSDDVLQLAGCPVAVTPPLDRI
jgi:nucleotide-binding universal stress UspA family protein